LTNYKEATGFIFKYQKTKTLLLVFNPSKKINWTVKLLSEFIDRLNEKGVFKAK
jgi:hypothetical protein